MNEFERTANDDFQRVWDNINELHEVTNITLKTWRFVDFANNKHLNVSDFGDLGQLRYSFLIPQQMKFIF